VACTDGSAMAELSARPWGAGELIRRSGSASRWPTRSSPGAGQRPRARILLYGI